MRIWSGLHQRRVQYPCVKDGVPCPDRHPGCQDHCKAFQQAAAENARLREEEHEKQKKLGSYAQSLEWNSVSRKTKY